MKGDNLCNYRWRHCFTPWLQWRVISTRKCGYSSTRCNSTSANLARGGYILEVCCACVLILCDTLCIDEVENSFKTHGRVHTLRLWFHHPMAKHPLKPCWIGDEIFYTYPMSQHHRKFHQGMSMSVPDILLAHNYNLHQTMLSIVQDIDVKHPQ